MKHANYMYLKESGRLKDQYIEDERITEHLACGEFVAKMYEEYSGTKVPYIRNILAPKKKTEKIYRFLSTSRVYDPDKGWNEIIQFCGMLKKAKIKFEFTIFSNLPEFITPEMIPFKEIHVYEPRLDIFDYIADTDYVVLFTRSEGCPYSILEALQYQTPCIVSDVGGCTELIQDGVNGYVVDDLDKFDIEKIKKIPKLKAYKGSTAEEWCEYLGGAEYIEKPLKEYGKVKVRAIDHYTDMSYPTNEGYIQKNITPGDEYEVDEDRAKELVDGQYAEYTGGL
jgi:glycosyltransferase involved in cell wall biosynthesis